jgi:hypothetical protein
MRVKLLQTIEETQSERPVRFPKGSYCNFAADRAATLIAAGAAESAPAPELVITKAENPSTVVIAFTHAGDLKLFIGGEEQANAPTSPITVQRGASTVEYLFVVERNGSRGENGITIPALDQSEPIKPTRKARGATEA